MCSRHVQYRWQAWGVRRAFTQAGDPRTDDTRTEVLKSNEGFWIDNERRGVIMREERTAWAEPEGKKYIVTAKTSQQRWSN